MLRNLFVGLAMFAVAVTSSPESLMRLSPEFSPAHAQPHGRGGGFSGGGRAHVGGGRTHAGGARARPGPVARPRPAVPATRPAAPAYRPPVARPPVARPPVAKPPVARPPGYHPPGYRPPGARPPVGRPPVVARPPGYRPPGVRPPVGRPPVARPPGYRPPGWRPPYTRPPYYRPPYYRPPYYRPPDPRWGNYYYNPNWGWYFTAALVGSTLIYAATLPEDKECEKVRSEGETLYSCDGVLYRATSYKDQQVYEIVSDPEPQATQAPAEPDSVIGLSLTQPMTRGAAVRDLQNRLSGAGYDVGGVDGVFGSGTRDALEWFQYDNGLEVNGIVDVPTAGALGFRPAGQGMPQGAVAPQPATQSAAPAGSPAPTDAVPLPDGIPIPAEGGQ